MKTRRTARFRIVPLIPAAAFWSAALLIGGLWLVRANDSGWWAMPPAAFLAWTVAGITWQQLRARARRRWRAALDAYAEREIRQERGKTALKRVTTRSTAWALSRSFGNALKPRTRLTPVRAAR
jgi:hypothetical protein